MDAAKEKTVERFAAWLDINARQIPLERWGPGHTEIACRFAEHLLREDHEEFRFRVLRDKYGDVISSGEAQEDE